MSGNQDEQGTTIPSRFKKIYMQSLEAEHRGLDEIAGMGYRKAIEFLVKDWAIQNHPDNTEEIKGARLSQVISKFYEGEFKDILERGTWLGNDETHYVRLFEEFNIDDLKELINLMMAELDKEYKKSHYITKMDKRK